MQDQIDGSWLRSFAMGIHSNIPICCVFYYCNVWSKYSVNDLESFKYDREEPDEVNYIRCPDCYKNDRRVEIHRCDPNGFDCFLDDFNKAFFPPMRGRPTRRRKPKTQPKKIK